MAATVGGITLLVPFPTSTPAKRTTRMMLGRKSDSSSSSSSNGVSPVKANGVGTILKMATEKQWKLLDRREREDDQHVMIGDPFGLGEVVKDMRIFCENFTIRSYDMGPNRTASIETLMNLLQETALNNIKNMGILKDGLGSTPEMSGRSLIWVLSKMHVVVDHYPSWGDDVQVDNWLIPSNKNGQGTEWIIRDSQTCRTLTRATSVFVMMNKKTRKLSKMPEEVKREMETHYIDYLPTPIADEDSNRIVKFDYNNMDYVRTGLTPRWSDLDANQHVNNVKYIGLMLESVPISILEGHEISEVNVEYRRECGMDDALQSLTSVCSQEASAGGGGAGHHECLHLLRSENGAVVARGRTKWRPK
ncbi:palmitoyl-acyl carrier protein thioesterase, chloroplastic-like [Telopea speciosissima]|uniref:palmitoyl-acyl carrier protein thioesterase, chloroplastic-like n=1 Tax=Telopea speciosissima TaxID=54955 RepID=UPI001CC5AE77|nr:palmitoyl-acyl carrier protein thioesterase, chloroplastic-like [Telopea speciosissima]